MEPNRFEMKTAAIRNPKPEHVKTNKEVSDWFHCSAVVGTTKSWPAKIMLAHVASAEGIIAAENAMGGSRQMSYDAVPGAIFTSPEVANVGLTADQAKEKGLNFRADTVLFRTIGKAQVIGELAGETKIVSDVVTGKVLGFHIIGPHATDLIAEGTLAVTTGRTVQELAETIHAHPTLAEVTMETAFKAMGRALHG